jgi:hypothetical protein
LPYCVRRSKPKSWTLLPVTLLTLLVFSGSAAPVAATSGAGTRAGEFLRMPAEPEGRSLGGAHLGSISGPAALAWNPAGLGATESPALILSHATWMAETSWEWGAVSLPVAARGDAIGISVGAFRAGKLEQYDREGNALGTFSPVLTTAAFGYAVPLSTVLRVGISLEGILERSGTGEESMAWAGGLGLQWDAGRFSFGLSGLHIGPEARVGEERYPLPTTVRGAATLAIAPSLRFHAGGEWIAEGSPGLIAGAEWQPVGGLRALTGLRHDPSSEDKTLQPTYGLACAVGAVAVTYGYQPAQWLDDSHQVSITLGSATRR